MNILFLTMSGFSALNGHGIYEDLIRTFVREGHFADVVSPVEKRDGIDTHISETSNGFRLLRVRTGNLQKTNLFEKGIATVRISAQFKKAIKKFFAETKYDLILYTTPPITLYDTVKYFKKRDKAQTLLLLKDIFPQNAVDIGVLKKSGLKGIIYQYFRKKEKKLYAVSDYIGCMSRANVDYVLSHNPAIDKTKIGVIPNSIEPVEVSLSAQERVAMREKYGIPQDKTVFVYGGNLGKPQGIPFIIECLRAQKDNEKAFFFIVGDGTEYHLLEEFTENEKPRNVKVMQRLPREDFDTMIAACDVGLIFLDHRFTIPNYPSRLLSYLQAGLPVLACTDPRTDIGQDIVENGFGWRCESNAVEQFAEKIQESCACDWTEKGIAAKKYLQERLTAKKAYGDIMRIVETDK